MTRLALLIGMVLLLRPVPAAGQGGQQLLRQGITAYQRLEFSSAADFLRRALNLGGGEALPADDRIEALAYLGAVETGRRRVPEATEAFRELVLLDPAYELDPGFFPSAVRLAFASVKTTTKAVRVDLPDRETVAEGELYTLRLTPSSRHDITTFIQGPDAVGRRVLYDGPVSDAVDVAWDGRIDNQRVPAGSYTLIVASRLGDDVLRHLRVPLTLTRPAPDTLAHPAPLDASLFLPEQRRGGGTLPLAAGLAAGAATVILPTVLGADDGAGGLRFAVGGSIALAGVLGYVTGRRAVPLPANAQRNAELRDAWARDMERVAQENRARRGQVHLVIRSGPTARVEGDWR